MNYKNIITSENQQIKYLIKTIAFFWLITKLFSYKTWIADRIYPVIPPFDFLKNIPDYFHLILFVIGLFILLLILFFKINKWLLILFFLFETMSCLLDTVRWQPWEYMYLCMLLVVITNFSKPKNIVFLFHLLFVATYLFGGLHKLNRDFLSSAWMNMILKDFFGLSLEFILKFKLFFVGLLIPIAEILLAVFLFFLKSKKIISYLLIVMHLIILIIIGPFGLDYNSVIWFWNLAIIFILLILYALPIKNVERKTLLSNSYWLVLWFLMPILSFFGYWYYTFSFRLFSGKADQLYICVKNQNKELEPYLEAQNSKFCGDKPYVIVQNWAMSEIKSGPFPENDIYRKIGIEIKKKYGNKNVKIYIRNKQTNKTEEL